MPGGAGSSVLGPGPRRCRWPGLGSGHVPPRRRPSARHQRERPAHGSGVRVRAGARARRRARPRRAGRRRRRPDGRSGSSRWATSTSRPSCAGWPGRTRVGSCSSSGPATPPTTSPGRTRRPSTRCAPTPRSSTRPPSSTAASSATPTSSSAPPTAGWSATPSWPAPRACRRCSRSPPTPRCCARPACPPPPSPGSSSAVATCATSPSTTSCRSTSPGAPASTRCCSRTATSAGPAGWGDPLWLACGRCEVCEPEVEAARDLLLVAGVRGPTRRKLIDAGVTTIDDLAVRTEPVADVRGRHPRPAARAGPAPARAGARPRRWRALRGDRPRHPATDAARRAPVTSSSTSRATRCGPSAARAPGAWSTSSASSRSTPAHRCSAPSGPTTATPSGRPSSTSSAGSTARRRQWPDLHVYHYAAYETAALLRLAGPPRGVRGRGRPAAARRGLRRPLRRRPLGHPGVPALVLDQEARAALHGGPRGRRHQRRRLDRRLPPVHGGPRRRAARRGRRG